jgi:hypothetical protein
MIAVLAMMDMIWWQEVDNGGSNDITTGGPLKNNSLQMERECKALKKCCCGVDNDSLVRTIV